MTGLGALAWLVPLPPLLAAALLTLRGGGVGPAAAPLALGALLASAALALAVLAGVATGGPASSPIVSLGSIGGRPLTAGFVADPLSALLAVLVAGVGLVVFAYAATYILEDAGYARFFAQLSLFVGGMLALVLASSLLLLYVAWEVVGLASFLLIGFDRARPAAGRAAAKAFLVTRIGDLGLLLGILLLVATLGDATIAQVNAAAASGALGEAVATAAALLVLLGALGKSAQVPLHVWLPDAMEGPTPVSALIHSATMVAAGVFLVARFYPLFEAAGPALAVVAILGSATALLGAAAAAAQRDLKRVLAYSTMSQLGEMMAALGAGAPGASLFHLATQALFKAALFLAAGSIGRALGTTDLRAMGGLRASMPRTFLAFALAALALAAVPPFGGFWSGDAVLTALWRAYPLLFAVVLAAVGLAGFYTTRALLLAFCGAPRGGRRVHESPPGLWAPALLLTTLAAVAGLLDAPPLGSPLSRLLGEAATPAAPAATALALLAAASGIGVAVARYVSAIGQAGWRLGPAEGVTAWALAGFGLDRLYAATLARGVRVAARRLAAVDAHVIDGATPAVVALARAASGSLQAFDRAVLDRFADALARGALALARTSARWDLRRLDRLVTRFALGWRLASSRLARTQTGRVYQYLLAVALWGAVGLAAVLVAGLSERTLR